MSKTVDKKKQILTSVGMIPKKELKAEIINKLFEKSDKVSEDMKEHPEDYFLQVTVTHKLHLI